MWIVHFTDMKMARIYPKWRSKVLWTSKASSSARTIARDWLSRRRLSKNKELRGRAVLVHTGWDEHWATDKYYENHPFLTEDAAVYLKQCGVKLVGIDSHNIDDTRGNTRPVHSTLLRNEILIAEHLCNLVECPRRGIHFQRCAAQIQRSRHVPRPRVCEGEVIRS